MSTSVKHIHSGMRGAPTINGTAGTLIAALDALFTTGWGVTTALSVNVASGVATATLTSGQTFDRDSVVLVEGATPSGLNGEARVLTSSNTSITWATEAADGAATGTITIRYAPQTSWEKVYAGTNKAVYRSSDVQSNGHFLRIDDTGTVTARVRGFESMSDVDTGSGPFPTDAQMSGGGYFHKSVAANSTPVKWRIFCDSRFILFCIAAGVAANAGYVGTPPRGFGDPLPLAPGGDAWCTLLSFNGSANNASPATSALTNSGGPTASGMTVSARPAVGLGGSVQMVNTPFTGIVGSSSGSDSALGVFPSEVDGQAKTSRMFTRENATGKPPRSITPGVLYIPQSGAITLLTDGDILSGEGDLAGRKLMVVADIVSTYASPPVNAYLVDITGPWR